MQKIFVKILAVTAACFAISYAASLVGGLTSDPGYPMTALNRYNAVLKNEKAVNLHQKFASEGMEEIEIDAMHADIMLRMVDGNEILTDLKGNFSNDVLAPLVDHAKDGKLFLRVNRSERGSKFNFSFDLGDGSRTLNVGIPKGIKRVIVKTVNGNLDGNDLKLEKLEMETTSGDMGLLKRTEIFSMAFKSVSGDLVCLECKLGKLESKTVSGDVALTLRSNPIEISATTTSGDLEIQFDKKPDVTVDFFTVSGDFSLDPEFGKAQKERRRSQVTVGSGKGYIEARTTSGDVTIGKF